MVNLYIQAEKSVLLGKEITINGRSMEYEDLDLIRAGRKEWQKKVDQEAAKTGGGSSTFSLADFS